jgi:hypothetical protein
LVLWVWALAPQLQLLPRHQHCCQHQLGLQQAV